MTGCNGSNPPWFEKGFLHLPTVHFPGYVSFGTGFVFLDEVDLKSSDDLFGALVLGFRTVETFVCLKGRSGNGSFEIFLEIYCTLNLKLTVSFFPEDRLDTNRKVVQWLKNMWHSPYMLVYKDPLLTYLLVFVPSILT